MPTRPISRRRFLALTGATLSACCLGTCARTTFGLGFSFVPAGSADPILPLGAPNVTLGVPAMSKKILVAYATAAGSTGGVAETIGQTLADDDTFVSICPVQSVASLEGYDAVVLGSAIHGGKWLPEATAFLQANRARLNQIPTAFFLVGLIPNRKGEGDKKLVDSFLAAERALVKPVAEGRFVGAMFAKDNPGLAGFGIRFFIAYCGLGLRPGDFRDPAAIRAWAETVRPLLVQ